VADRLFRLGQSQRQLAHFADQPLRLNLARDQIGEASRVELVFGDEYPRGQRVCGIARAGRNRDLAENGAFIEIGGNEVDGAARMGIACIQRALVGVEASVFRQ